VRPVDETDEVMLITRKGIIIRTAVSGISTMSRNTQGVKLMNLDEGDVLMDVARVVIEDDPDDLDARLMLARLDVETARYEEAISALESILAEFPGNLEARADLELARSRWHREGRRPAFHLGVEGWSVGQLPLHQYFKEREASPCS